ncbi:hypothetical protein PVAND_017604, partial [Polypedilum vanderplanki]
MPELRM